VIESDDHEPNRFSCAANAASSAGPAFKDALGRTKANNQEFFE
jgi:hypothetical protein